MDDQSNPLIASIIDEAKDEALRIVAQSEKIAQTQVEQAEKRAQEIVAQAEAEASQRIERHLAQVVSSLEMEKKRIALQQRATVSRHIISLVEKRFAEIVDTPRYRELLKSWIVEGVIGLESSWAEILASPKDPIDQALLDEAMEESSRQLGFPVTLVLAERRDPTIQGVSILSKDGKTAYNNTVATRMKRYATEMYGEIHRGVLGVGNE